MRYPFETEFKGRKTISEAIAGDPEQLHKEIIKDLVRALTFAKHYDGYGTAFAIFARDNLGFAKILSGSNYKPFRGSLVRVCAEQATLLGSVEEGDSEFGGTAYFMGPESKDIVGSKFSNYLRPCDVCHPMVEKISSTLLFASFRAPTTAELATITSSNENMNAYAQIATPGEVFSLKEIASWQEGFIEELVMPDGVSTRQLAISGLSNRFSVPVIPRPRAVTAEEVTNHPLLRHEVF